MFTTPWTLSDRLKPLITESDIKSDSVESEGRLRKMLTHFATRSPSIVLLTLKNGGCLQVGIGGPFGGVAWHRSVRDVVFAQPNHRSTDKEIEFSFEGQPSLLEPEYLFPVDQLIDILAHLYTSGCLPLGICWIRQCGLLIP
jgi:hypothetical protein